MKLSTPYPRVYLKSRKYRLFLQTQRDFALKSLDSAEDTVTITNNKAGSIDTGVVLNNMPYILVLAVLAAGVAVFIIRKRRED